MILKQHKSKTRWWADLCWIGVIFEQQSRWWEQVLMSSWPADEVLTKGCLVAVLIKSRDWWLVIGAVWWLDSEQRWWWAEIMSNVDDEQMSMSRDSWQQIKETSDWWDDVTVSFNLKSKLVLLLRLGYLKPFLAGSKKTRQGPGCRVGAIHISRCWFYLTVVVGPKLI